MLLSKTTSIRKPKDSIRALGQCVIPNQEQDIILKLFWPLKLDGKYK